MGRRTRWATALVVAAAAALTLSACSESRPRPTPGTVAASYPPYSSRPNIVYVLTDDLSADLVRYMPHVQGLQDTGMTFSNYSVTDSLCCPSRSSIFTGEFPHDTGVFDNTPPDGGISAFMAHRDDQRVYSLPLRKAGYRTALLGKYINGYQVGASTGDLPGNYVPPGWSTWAVADNGYPEFSYELNENGAVKHYGTTRKDYLTNVIAQQGSEFIQSSVRDRKPFALELATFAPHLPATPDPHDADSFLGLTAPRPPSFGRIPTDAPKWMRQLKPLRRSQLAALNRIYVKRVESVQAVDRAIGTLETTLRRTGQLGNTVFIFNSDNGFHLGQHGLFAGKRTAFDTDVHTPLVVSGPHIKPGSTSDAMVQNIDLAPTFEQLAGARVPSTVDGRSIVPLLHGTARQWRTIAAVEHHGPDARKGDPDTQPLSAGNPPSYVSLRGPSWTFTKYADGTTEYYDRKHDPYELHNTVGQLSSARLAELERDVVAIGKCHGGASCWAAGRPARL